MFLRRTIFSLIIVCSAFLSSPTWAAGAYKYSGFLGTYPELKLDPDGSGSQMYRKANTDLGEYDKILIAPIEVWMADDSKYKGFSPDALKDITDELHSKLVAHLDPDFPVVSRPGKGVLVIRLAITDVYAKKKKRGLFGYVPIAAAVGAAAGTYRPKLEDATIEAELLDSESHEQLAVLIDKLSVSQVKKGNTSWDEITANIDFYAKRFRSKMDAAHAN